MSCFLLRLLSLQIGLYCVSAEFSIQATERLILCLWMNFQPKTYAFT